MGIGTLNERSLHAYLKSHYEPDRLKHEVKLGRYVADIQNADGIIEIQTRNFSSLAKKLAVFLEEHDVTVIYPVAQVKRLVWVDPETGETTKPRRSPKTGTPFELFYELIYLRDLLSNPRLHFLVVLLDLCEYRLLDGWSRDRKKGSTRRDRVPNALIREVPVQSARALSRLLPASLPQPFTAADLARAAKSSPRLTQRALTVLRDAGVIERCGKADRAFLYAQKADGTI